MKEELLKYTCDQCRESITITKGAYCGTVLDRNWIRLYIKVKQVDVVKTKLHFCSEICAEEFLHERNKRRHLLAIP